MEFDLTNTDDPDVIRIVVSILKVTFGREASFQCEFACSFDSIEEWHNYLKKIGRKLKVTGDESGRISIQIFNGTGGLLYSYSPVDPVKNFRR